MAKKAVKEVKNKYLVPKNLWRKFRTNTGKQLYNDIMKQMLPNQSLTIHPKTPKIPKDQWGTICHNAACYAVWALEKDPLKKGETVKSIDMRTEKVLKVSKAK